jgi:glutathionylspermidine synthase
VIRLYKRWAETVARRVVLGSPYNLELAEDGALTLFDEPIDLIVRHYKTDWWGERASAWDDEVLSDEEPLSGPLGAVLECAIDRRVSVMNPFGSVLPQNKRSMAFMWERIHRFSTRSQSIIERHVPVTSRFESMHKEQLRVQKDTWVLKSDYGAEGEEVVVGRFTDDVTWQASLDHARNGHWVAQRYFEALGPTAGEATNYGVYVIAGRAAGVYARVQAGPTDDRALSAAVLIE